LPNVLIYLGPKYSTHHLDVSYALRANGYLLLGTAESVREHPELFTTQDRKHKFFSKHRVAQRSIPSRFRG
jgi:two-component system CheB/CheR fusion protein